RHRRLIVGKERRMSARSCRFAASAALLLVLGSLATARGATLSRAEWQSGGSSGMESLVLHFSGGAPALNVDAQPWGLSIFLPGTKLDAVGAEGIKVVDESGGSRMQVERAGMEIRSLRIEGEAVRIQLGKRLAESPGQGYRIGVGDVV